jgi:putative transferase (TIGR04331 family)
MTNMKKYILILTENHNVNIDSYNCIYLGPWCKGDHDKTLNLMVDKCSVKNELTFIGSFQEKISSGLAAELNIIHDVNYSNDYWKILLGSWLFSAISTFSDRINAVEYALDKQSIDFILVQSNLKKFTPKSSYHFLKLSDGSDEYNQYLFSRILQELFDDIDFGVVSFDSLSECSVPDTINSNKSVFRATVKSLRFKVLKTIARFKKTIVTASAIDIRTMKGLFFGTGATPFSAYDDYQSDGGEIDLNKRLLLYKGLKKLGGNAKEQMIIKLISEQIPMIFLEDYCGFVGYSDKKYDVRVANILTGTEIYNNNAFAHFLAISKERGTVLLGVQHGGNYGVNTIGASSIIEQNNFNFFYAWGSNNLGYGDKSSVRVMPSTKLMKNKKKYKDASYSTNILYVLTSVRRYVARQSSIGIPYFNQSYMDNQKKFISYINKEILSNLVIRKYNYERCWDYFSVLKSEFPSIQQDNLEQEFIVSLSSCKLFVVDHLSTTWLESLSLNKPTIMFWSDIYDIDSHVSPYFNSLREVGILHNAPESAAEKINEIYEDIESWWMQDVRQKVVREFCNVFAYMPENPLEMWREELNEI